ncbi:hypothetical protein KAW64_13410, partial [bacterium]|nr:hypothetical protein [bacterium]
MATLRKTTESAGLVRAGDRIPPQAHEAEVAVLGAMMLDEEAIGAGAELLTSESFYTDAHRKIFAAVMDLFSKSEAVDLVTLTQALKRRKHLDDIGGAAYLSTLLGSVATAANVRYHAKIVLE